MGSLAGSSAPALIESLLDRIVEGVLLIESDGRVQYANAAAAALLELQPGELTGTYIELPPLTAESQPVTLRHLGGERYRVQASGIETHVEKNGERRPAWLVCLHLPAEPSDAQQRHSAQMQTVGRLTAGIAHDFNNLLTVVLGNLDSARRQLAAGTEQPLRAIENAIHGARRAAVLAERLLALSRRTPHAPRALEVNSLIAGMSDLLRRTLGERIAIRTKLGKDLWPVEADATELETAILNLAVNARDAMPEGGDLVIETANVQMDATASTDIARSGAYVSIAVTDTGTGMSAELIETAFEPFFTTKPERGGTGLGLSQVRDLATQTGGHVQLHSESGRGTTATIYLPRTSRLRESSPSDPVELPLPHGTADEVILVVEDNPDVLGYTVESLAGLGYTVLPAVDAASALQLLSGAARPRLLITDLGLPGGIDGRQLTARVRQSHPSLPVLITTAYAAPTLYDGQTDADIGLLNKPFTIGALAQRVRELLDRSTATVRGSARILIVDDEPLVRMFICEMLAEHGYGCEETGSFAEAMARLRRNDAAFDAAIIDLGLPDRSGADAAREIRTLHPRFPIVLTTGHAGTELRQRYAFDPDVRILVKPFDRATLLSQLISLGIVGPLPT